MSRLFVAAAACAALLASLTVQGAYAASPPPTTNTTAAAHPAFKFHPRGEVPLQGAAHKQATSSGFSNPICPGCAPPLLFGGTPSQQLVGGSPYVMGSFSNTPGQVTIVPVFWQPPGYSFTPNYQSIIDQYVDDIAAASNTSTNVFSVYQEYYDSPNGANRPLVYHITHGADIVDTHLFPPGACPVTSTDTRGNPTFLTTCVSDGQLQAELTRLGVASSDKVVYQVLFPPHVETCQGNAAPWSACSAPVTYCGYHSGFNTSATTFILYSNLPFPLLTYCADDGASGAQAPNGDPYADAQLSIFSHEANEAITDSFGAWFDANGYENGDECAYVYGAESGSNGSLYNQSINGHHYLTQVEFSNAKFNANQGVNVDNTHATFVAGCVPSVTTANPATHFQVVWANSATRTGTGYPTTVTVNPLDAGNNVTHAYSGTVSFTSSDGSATLPASYTFTPADDGSHVFSVKFGVNGNQTLTATDSVTGTIAGTSAGILVLQARAALPALANTAYGGYTTHVYVKNSGGAPATLFLGYINSSGAAVGRGDSPNLIAPNGMTELISDDGNGLAVTQPGSGTIYSDQPVSAFVSEAAPGGFLAGDASSYSAIPVPGGAAGTLYAPAIAENAYGGYTTGLGLINLANSATNITITYRGALQDGTPETITQTLNNVAAGAYQGVYSGNSNQPTDAKLPSTFAGTATITSSSGNLAGIVNEVGPAGAFSSYDMVTTGASTLYMPTILNNGYGGYFTGLGLLNVTSISSGNAVITYYDGSGNPVKNVTLPIAAFGYLGVYSGDPAVGPPASGSGYTAKVTATGGVMLAGIVNEVASAPGGFTAYNAFSQGSSSFNLPLTENGGSDPWNTGPGVMNTGSTTTTVTFVYYDPATGNQIGSSLPTSLQPNAFWGAYSPSSGLPPGHRATAVVTASSGGSIAVICNEANGNGSLFMSYDGQ